jgi:hypothetical protein
VHLTAPPATRRAAPPSGRAKYRPGHALVIAVAVLIGLPVAAVLAQHEAQRGPATRPAGTVLRVDGNPGSGAGVILPNLPVRVPYFYLAQNLCTANGPVTITGVRLVRPQGHLALVDWAVSNSITGPADINDAAPGQMSALRRFGHQPVTTACPTPSPSGKSAAAVQQQASAETQQRVTQFGFSVRLTGPAGTSDAIALTWRQEQDTGELVLRFAVGECTAAHCPIRPRTAPSGASS